MKGSKTLPTAVRLWIRLNCWKMKPSFLRLTTSCSSSFIEVSTLSSMAIVPDVGDIEGAEKVQERALARAGRTDDEREGTRWAPRTRRRAGRGSAPRRSGRTFAGQRHESCGAPPVELTVQAVSLSIHEASLRMASIGVMREARQAG